MAKKNLVIENGQIIAEDFQAVPGGVATLLLPLVDTPEGHDMPEIVFENDDIVFEYYDSTFESD
jgi:hypothetical protein